MPVEQATPVLDDEADAMPARQGWLLNASQAAELLGVHRHTFSRMVSDRQLPGPIMETPLRYWHRDDLTAEGIRKFREKARRHQ